MTTGQGPVPKTGTDRVDEFVAGAREVGEQDSRCGKRCWTRYSAGMPLDVTEDACEPRRIQAVTMHSASGGGFSFWSRKALASDLRLFVREYLADTPGEWLEASVRHCTQGLRGYLIGAAFEEPSSPNGVSQQ